MKPKCILGLVFRVSFGLSLLLVGVAHYMGIQGFIGMVADGLGPLSFFGQIWAYVLPGLMIVGGALFVVGMYTEIATLAAGVALGSIPVGMLAKPVLGGVPLSEMMPAAVNAFIWLIIYALVVKITTCKSGSCSTESCDTPS